MNRIVGFLLVSCFLVTASAVARRPQDRPETKPTDRPAEKPEGKKEIPRPTGDFDDGQVVTHHTIDVGGKPLAYTARAGTLLLREEDGKKKAAVFYVAYTKDEVTDAAARPITYSFNGGPGSSSVWLHLGAIGPKRVDLGPDGLTPTLPYRLVDNDAAWLDLTDLVFIDPVTTGYSRAVPGESDAPYHGVESDVQSVGDFIRLYTTKEKRWPSPKFLAGESYGTTRAAALANYLQQRHGMYLHGVMLISTILNFETAEFDAGNDLPFQLFLPTYTATAFFHQKLAPELQRDLRATLTEAEAFAAGDYAVALGKGSALTDAERQAVGVKIARYTGLSPDYVDRSNLRIDIQRFCKELRRADRRCVGRLDSRFQGIDRDAAGATPDADPSYSAIQGPYTAALNNYLRVDLNYESDLVYEILTGRVHPWRFDHAENRYLNVAERLRQAMTQNPALRVFVACGYYDLATPYAAARYTFDHLAMDREISQRVTFGYYESGHMMYIHGTSRAQLRKDIGEFFRTSLSR